MTPSRKIIAASMLGGLLLPGGAIAHGDIAFRIADLDRRIEAGPPTAELLIKRAELHRSHGAWSRSERDLDRAVVLAPDDDSVRLYRGRLLLESGQVDRAKGELDAFIERHPRDPRALVLRARSSDRLGDPLEGANDLALAIALLASSTPELYLARARMLARSDEIHADQVLTAIDGGIERLGPVVSLVEFAIAHESSRSRYRSALAYLERLPRALLERPIWLIQRAELLRSAGRDELARAAIHAARESIQALPHSRAGAPAMLALGDRLKKLERQP